MRLYIVRHGETDWNKTRRMQGKSDIPLNDFGRRLARDTRDGLKEVAFDIAYTSPLIRAKETAEIILGDRQIPLIEDERIQEIGFGEFEGLCCSKEGYNIPDPGFENFFSAPGSYHPPKGGESYPDILRRLQSFLEELYGNKELEDKTVLIATHGAALRGMLVLMKQLPLEQFWIGGVHKNCAVSIIDVKDKKAEIIEEAKVYYTCEGGGW